MENGTPLQKVLQKGLSPGGDLYDELDTLEGYVIESAEDGKAICAALEMIANSPDSDDAADNAQYLCHLLQEVKGPEAVRVVSAEGLPLVERLLDSVLTDVSSVLFAMKIFALHAYEPGLNRIPELIRKESYANQYLWTAVFSVLAKEGHPQQKSVAEKLADPLPAGFARVAYLDFVNELCHMGVMPAHPFDTPVGIATLQGLLGSAEAKDFSYAASAAMALAFLRDAARDRLLEIGRKHPDMPVQIETAWADGYMGHERGLEFLASHCADAPYSRQACAYLTMLDREDLIPAEVKEPGFQATAEMIGWLSHPNEYGCPPDSIELIDTREMFWPPTQDTRTVWAFKYRYLAIGEDDEDSVDYGMAGSTPFSLFDCYGDDPSPEDIYALHCSWEIDGEPDLERGREILAEQKLR
jgi:hypothetical protein